VDDEPIIRELLSRLLRRANHVVHVASGSDAAIQILESTCIGAILVDRHMPGRDGDWLVAQVRERFPATAIILATGEYVPSHVSAQQGVVGFLAKPFTAEVVIQAVADAMVWHQVAARKLSR
jgi:two-component system response regulator AlgR